MYRTKTSEAQCRRGEGGRGPGGREARAVRWPGSGAAPCRGSSLPHCPLPPPTDTASLTKTCLVEPPFVHNAACHYRQLLSKSRQYRGRNSLYPLSTQRNIALPLQLQTHLVVRCARTSPGSSNQLIIRQLSAFQVAQRPLDANARSKIIVFLRQEPPHVTAILVM